MNKYSDISEDLICDICTNYILIPWLSKQILRCCNNNEKFRYLRDKNRAQIICDFVLSLDSGQRNLLKQETLNKFYFSCKNEDICNYIETYGPYVDLCNYNIYFSDEILEKYKDSIDCIKQQYLRRKIRKKQALSTEDYLYCIKNCIIVHSYCYIDKSKITKEIILEYINCKEFNLNTIPQDLLTYEICLKAVSKVNRSIQHIPPNLIDYEICKTAIFNNTCDIVDIPKEYLTYELCKQSLIRNGNFLSYIEKNAPNIYNDNKEEFTKIASCTNYDLLLQIIRQFSNKVERYEYLKYVLTNNPDLLYLFSECLNTNLCKLALSKNGLLLQDIKRYRPDLITEELCNIAVNNKNSALIYVPKEYQTEKMWINTITNTNSKITSYEVKKIPSRLLTKSVCQIILRKNKQLALDHDIQSICDNDFIYKSNKLCCIYLGEKYIKQFIQEYDL